MPDYQNGKIYKLYSPSKNLVYYGSTTQSLPQRLTEHIKHYKHYNNNEKTFLSSFLVIECEDYKIELVEDYPCNNKQQLSKKEGEYIKTNECVNSNIAGRTIKEWHEDNKEYISDKKLTYQREHKEQKAKTAKKYYENNKEKIYEYQKQWRLKQKELQN